MTIAPARLVRLLDATAISDGRTAVVVSAGRDKNAKAGDNAVIADRYDPGTRTWKALPTIGARISDAGSVWAAQISQGPCVGFAMKSGRAWIGCLAGDHWNRVAGTPTSAVFNQLSTVDGQLLALYRSTKDEAYFVEHFDGAKWRRLGQRLPAAECVAKLAVGDVRRADIVLQGVGRPPHDRQIWSFERGRWRKAGRPLTGIDQGPMTSGPARDAGGLLLTTTAASNDPWPFALARQLGGRWPIASRPQLNYGPGNAQGNLVLTHGQAWAAWQQNALAQRGQFKTEIWAQRVSTSGLGDRQLVWRGNTIGPGRPGVLDVDNEPWAFALVADPARPGEQLPLLRRLR